ncbi:MAG: TIGR04211 family SH3 domain-containing protein [Pseudomonadota bacterium]
MRLILGLLVLLPLTAVAETAYVTDNLRLGLYEAEDTSGRPFRTMESGQAMEILLRATNTANVQLPDGTTGWVKTAYLVTDKPAKLIVAETMAERDALSAELEETRAAFAEPAATIDALERDAVALNQQIETADARIAELESEVESVAALKQRYKGSLPVSWVGGAIIVCLVAGFLLGLWWTDRRSRARHGGIRVY